MLQFFRKHQKIFFVFVTFIIVISFVFFGTFSSLMTQPDQTPVAVGQTLDGAEINERDVHAVMMFLQTGVVDEGRSLLEEELFESGLALKLAEKSFMTLQEPFNMAYRKIRYFQPYAHPQASFVGAASVWERFAPEINSLLDQIRKGPETCGPAEVALLIKLYNAQLRFSPELLRQLVYYQQQQYSWIQQDPALGQIDLSIAGLQKMEDWFGNAFVQEASRALMNAGILAEQKGYGVAKDEALTELVKGAERAFSGRPNAPVGRDCFYMQLRYLGVEENRAIFLWQKLSAFNRMLQEVGSAVFIDPLSIKDYVGYAHQEVKVRLFSLPEELVLKDFRSLLKLERYLDAVAPQHRPRDLPTEFVSVQEVEKKSPQLVQKRFQVEIAEVDAAALSARMSLKQTWDWELVEAHFARLAEEFPILRTKPAKTSEERYAALEGLDGTMRLKVDEWSRLQLIAEHPEWVDDALQKAHRREQELVIHLEGGTLPFAGATDASAVINLLQQGSDLGKISFDQHTFYSVHVIGAGEKEIVPFAQAASDGTLDRLVDQSLEASYPAISKKGLLKRSDGTPAPFEESKDRLAALVYADKLGGLTPEEAPKSWLVTFEERVRQQLIAGATLASSPWSLVESEEVWNRTDARYPLTQTMALQSWSQPQENGFFQLLEKREGTPSTEQIEQAQAVLGARAKEKLVAQLFDAVCK